MQDWTFVLTAIEHVSSHPERFSKELAAQGYTFRARLYCRQEHYKLAISDCDRALAFDERCAEAFSVRGRASSLLGKGEAALSDCTKAIELAGWPVHYYRRGLVHKQLGNYDQAFADFEQACQREPENMLFKQEHTELLMLRLVRMGVYAPSTSQ
jgi:tetratricopeptide (TPR) repeat protein